MNIHNIKIPDHNPEVGKVLDSLQNAYERGEVESMIVVYTTKTGVSSAIVGNQLHLPMAAIVAETLAGDFIVSIQNRVSDDE
jgi:hypothetical protein